mmetsp:Transcript_17381/g.36328  ORF Transcript_17381/g.36328 Transcript_17381/m.36328 type:complete len:242 (-) Transcript_17381:604-1329(-)
MYGTVVYPYEYRLPYRTCIYLPYTVGTEARILVLPFLVHRCIALQCYGIRIRIRAVVSYGTTTEFNHPFSTQFSFRNPTDVFVFVFVFVEAERSAHKIEFRACSSNEHTAKKRRQQTSSRAPLEHLSSKQEQPHASNSKQRQPKKTKKTISSTPATKLFLLATVAFAENDTLNDSLNLLLPGGAGKHEINPDQVPDLRSRLLRMITLLLLPLLVLLLLVVAVVVALLVLVVVVVATSTHGQ